MDRSLAIRLAVSQSRKPKPSLASYQIDKPLPLHPSPLRRRKGPGGALVDQPIQHSPNWDEPTGPVGQTPKKALCIRHYRTIGDEPFCKMGGDDTNAALPLEPILILAPQ